MAVFHLRLEGFSEMRRAVGLLLSALALGFALVIVSLNVAASPEDLFISPFADFEPNNSLTNA
ncbi:hypothetical protein OAN31_01075, partial [Pseudomonadales bacterium]|nr:hypothetical protein [Pseudomonadales bacterium]